MNKEEIMAVAKCKGCDRMWDINGCSVSGQGPFLVQLFICDRCQEEGGEL